MVLIVAFGWWAVADLGSSTLTAQPEPIYVAGCPVSDPLGKSSSQGGVRNGRGCSKEGSSHPITSRRPGGGLDRHAHGAERYTDDRVAPRTSEHSSSRHLDE